MKKWTIVGHWTGGANKASGKDKHHYQAIIEGDGSVVYGDFTPEDQISTSDGIYGAHTRSFNTKCIGVAVAGMSGAKENPLEYGTHPINEAQFHAFCRVIAAFCREYQIPVTRTRVLLHSEVQPNLGIQQNGKWDINVLPWDESVVGHVAVGDYMRELVSRYLVEESPELSHLGEPDGIPSNRPTLEYGDRGADVRILQSDLNEMRYFVGRVDGHFGSRTRAAVLALQADAGVETDGIVGPRTWQALQNLEAKPLRDISEQDLTESGTIADTRRNDRLADLVAGGSAIKVVTDAQEAVSQAQATADGALSLWQTIQPFWPLALVVAVFLVWRGMNHSTRQRRVHDAKTGGNIAR